MNDYAVEFVTLENRPELATWIEDRANGQKFTTQPYRGMIATLNGKKIACLYYCCDIDGILLYGMFLSTNPKAKMKEKRGVVDFLIKHFINFAKHFNYQILKYDTNVPSVKRAFLRNGFIFGDRGCDQLLMGTLEV